MKSSSDCFKVGDWVQLVDTKDKHWVTPMYKYLGKIVKITYIDINSFSFEFNEGWYFRITDIAGCAKNRIVKEILDDL